MTVTAATSSATIGGKAINIAAIELTPQAQSVAHATSVSIPYITAATATPRV